MALTLKPIRGFPLHFGKTGTLACVAGYGNTINDSQTSLSPIFSGQGASVHRLTLLPQSRRGRVTDNATPRICQIRVGLGKGLNMASKGNSVFGVFTNHSPWTSRYVSSWGWSGKLRTMCNSNSNSTLTTPPPYSCTPAILTNSGCSHLP